MADRDLCYKDAVELSAMIRRGAITSEAIIRNALARIEALNPSLNAFCFVYGDEALAKASTLDREASAGRFRGPLHGIPYALKDLTPTKGKRTTLGSHIYRDWVPAEDAPIAEALERAGGILIGKTTTPEFAYAGFTESPLWGITRNPWNLEHTPGGSSGGSGVAVATGMVPLAEGSDMGGSVRIPASCCGIVGLKPSFGRIPFAIFDCLFDTLPHFGPLTRSLADAALFMEVTQGPDERDIQSNPLPLDFTRLLEGNLAGRKLGLLLDCGDRAWHPEIESAIRHLAAICADAGAIVEETHLPWGLIEDELWLAHWAVYLAAFFGRHLAQHRDVMDPRVVAYIERGLAMSAVDFKRIEIERARMWRELRPLLDRYDALLTGTLCQPPPRIGQADTDFYTWNDRGHYHAFDFTSVWNLVSQCPALSVPAGFTATGLPIGAQIIGRRFADRDVLDIGAAIERLLPWRDRHPPL